MRNLLIAFLLAIFSFQGAIVASGDNVVSASQLESRHASTSIEFVDHVDAAADGLKVSSTIEELSDYIILDLSISQARYPVTAQLLTHVSFLSINLPTIKPPPRG